MQKKHSYIKAKGPAKHFDKKINLQKSFTILLTKVHNKQIILELMVMRSQKEVILN